MRQARSFLVIAEDPQRLFLISNTLHRKFPNAVVQTCRESQPALAVAKSQALDAIIVNRSTDLDEIPLVVQLHAATPTPIVVMSGHHGEREFIAAGASRHLHPERWLLIGTVVGDLIGAHPAEPSKQLAP